MKRRGFLIAGGVLGGGALLVGYGLRAPSAQERLGDAALFPAKEGEAALNAWVKIGRDGRVTVAMPRAEMGQGVHTALAQLLAEELDADWSSLQVQDVPVAKVYANSALLLNVLPLQPDAEGGLARFARGAAQRLGLLLHLQVTGGSSSVRDAFEPLRLAGATARALLLQAAAQRLKVDASQLRTEAGHVLHGAQRIPYGELVEAAAQLPAPGEVYLKPRQGWKLIGKPMPRLDLPSKVDGTAVFGIDVRLPGMLYASLRQAPVGQGRIEAWDTSALLQRPGVKQAFVLDGRTAVVVAERWWQAESALRAHPPRMVAGAALDSAQLLQQLQAALDDGKGFAFRDDGDAEKTLAAAATTISADYRLPFLAHAALEPQNCTAQFKHGQLQIWAPTQVAALARWRAAAVADIKQEAVTVHTTYLGGGFGRRLETDVVEQATAIALRCEGAPVKLLWTREEDFTHDVYRPAALARFAAALGEDGLPTAWSNLVAGPSLTLDTMDRLLPAIAMDSPDKNQIEGAYELPYAIPNLLVRQRRVRLSVPVGSWRSVGHSVNAFGTECFLDELAEAARIDPLAYRERLLAGRPRHLQVLREAARLAGWSTPAPAGRARGIALHESFGSICAQVVEASLEGDAVRVHRVSVALDAGTLVNPDTVRAQMEGSVIFALSAALYGGITLAQGAVQQQNFPQQPLLSLADTPAIEVLLVDSQEAPGGVGEPGVPPLAPALVNAVSRLRGRRVRELPLMPV